MRITGYHGSSHLFLVRVQPDDATLGQRTDSARRCGKVQRVVDGEAYNFCGWPELIDHLIAMLSDPQSLTDPDSTDPGQEG